MLEVKDVERRDSVLTGSSQDSARRLSGRRDKWKERLNTQLLEAVLDNDRGKATWLLQSGASPEARCRESLTSVAHIAAAQGSTELLALLLGTSRNAACARDRAGRQPHHSAVEAGELDAVAALLSAAPELVDAQIQPPTDPPPQGCIDSWNHDHSQFNHMVAKVNEIGRTALHLASAKGDWKMVDLLLRVGARPSVADMNGVLPLDVAGQDWTTSLRRQAGSEEASVNKSNRVFANRMKMKRSLPLGKFVSTSDGNEAKEVNPIEKVCSLLVERGAEFPRAKVIVKDGIVINQRRMKVTALHSAVRLGDQELTTYLLSEGACPLTWDEEGLTAVHLAIRGRDEAMMNLFLKDGAEVRDAQGRTPLLMAVQEGWDDGVALLLEAEVAITTTSNSNNTVLHLAAQNGRSSILEELLSIPEITKILDRTNCSHETPLCLAVKTRQSECVKLLCDHGADTNFLLLPGDQSLLHIAVQNDSQEILQTLLTSSGRTRIDLVTKEEKGGVAPLHIAAAEGFQDCADELLSAGANPRVRTKRGETALHLAARQGHTELVRLLVKRDPGIMSDRTPEGWAPLHVAAAEGNRDCVKTMVLYGADLSATVKTELGDRSAVDIICSSIPNASDFLEETLNEYVEVVRGPINHPDCEILMNFLVLMPNGENEKQMKVIGAVMNCERQTVKDSVMLHPLIECYLYLKWNKFKFFFVFIMLLYFVLTLSLTTVAHLTFIEKNKTYFYRTVLIVARALMLLVLIPIICVEMVNFSQLQRHYLKDYETWVKWTMISLTCAVESLGYTYWLRYFASVAVLLSWVEMLFLLSRCPSWGFYVLMFSRVSIKISKVLATFSFLILGFAFSFLILFEAREPFRNMMESIVKVIVMMIEFDYEDMFSGSKEDLTSVIGRVMFAGFVLLVAMVMMNLIVGVAVSDIGRLETQGKTQQLAKQAAFLSFLEEFLYNDRLKGFSGRWGRLVKKRRALPRMVLVKPGRPSASQVWLPRSHLENILFHLKTREIGSGQNVSDSLRNISAGVDRVADTIRELYAEQKKSPLITGNRNLENVLAVVLDEQRAIRELIAARRVETHQPKLYTEENHLSGISYA